jgi:hypothetical protein
MNRVLIPLVAVWLLLFVVGSVPADAAGPSTVSGYISCSALAKGTSPSPSDADTVKKCLDKGGLTVIIVDDTHRVLTIENPDAVKGHEGHRVLLTGDINAGTIHVYSLRII